MCVVLVHCSETTLNKVKSDQHLFKWSYNTLRAYKRKHHWAFPHTYRSLFNMHKTYLKFCFDSMELFFFPSLLHKGVATKYCIYWETSQKTNKKKKTPFGWRTVTFLKGIEKRGRYCCVAAILWIQQFCGVVSDTCPLPMVNATWTLLI